MMSLLFNTLSRFVIAFLPKRSKRLNCMAAVTVHSDFGAQENQICQLSNGAEVRASQYEKVTFHERKGLLDTKVFVK